MVELQLQDLLLVNNYVEFVFKFQTSNSMPMPFIVEWDNSSVCHPLYLKLTLDPVRRSMCGSILYAKPALVEPFYLVDIQVHENAVGAVYSLLTKKRGVVINEEQREGTPMKTLQAHLPVNESFGFNEDLRGATHGQAFPQMVFDHWEIMSGNPVDPNDKSGDVVHGIRVRKGMQPNVQPAEYYIDKL